MNQKLKLVATDLDGTFLRNDKSITQANLDMLYTLGEQGVLRVIATGRNLHKTREVIPSGMPFDYVVFSSGAGVYDWQQEKLLYHQNLGKQLVQQMVRFFVDRDLNFHLFKPVPENHDCWFYRGSKYCSEFESYSDFHHAHAEPLPTDLDVDSEACQFLVVFPGDPTSFLTMKKEVENRFPEVKVVRTSSPFESGYIWMEIFHQSVSKGNGVRFICDTFQIEHEYTLGIGNDFNDMDLLEFTNYSYIVENGPQEMKAHFSLACSNENDAFACAVNEHLK